MPCNLKDQHGHILSCMPHPINPIPASSAFKSMKLVFMPPFPVPCSEDVFSSLPFSYPASLLSAFWHTPTLLFSSLNLTLYLFLQTKSFCNFHVFHTCYPISHSPLEHNHILATQPQMPPHTSFQPSTEAAALGNSSSTSASPCLERK